MSGEVGDARKRLSETAPERCGVCVRCNPGWFGMYVCATCGNKRCPATVDCAYECNRSNEVGQTAVLRTPNPASPDTTEAERLIVRSPDEDLALLRAEYDKAADFTPRPMATENPEPGAELHPFFCANTGSLTPDEKAIHAQYQDSNPTADYFDPAPAADTTEGSGTYVVLWDCFICGGRFPVGHSHKPCGESPSGSAHALVCSDYAGHPGRHTSLQGFEWIVGDECVEALEACREQRADLLALLEVEREQHAEALHRTWHEGYGAGSSDATDGWLKPGSPRRLNPYSVKDGEQC